jgi:hypothetical protein
LISLEHNNCLAATNSTSEAIVIEAFLNPIEEQVIDSNDDLVEQIVREFDPLQDDSK